jgi:hypothetical protein
LLSFATKGRAAILTALDLSLGDYCLLTIAKLCDPDQIIAASDDQILASVDEGGCTNRSATRRS